MIKNYGQVANRFELQGISGFSLKIQINSQEIHQMTQWIQDKDKWETL